MPGSNGGLFGGSTMIQAWFKTLVILGLQIEAATAFVAAEVPVAAEVLGAVIEGGAAPTT
ncbi:carbon-nitrogen hydrolase family protein [Sesbania bispinosa]|nr:carbon-nitrogen hydrolase family protein [Sesbania bispinosa]